MVKVFAMLQPKGIRYSTMNPARNGRAKPTPFMEYLVFSFKTASPSHSEIRISSARWAFSRVSSYSAPSYTKGDIALFSPKWLE